MKNNPLAYFVGGAVICAVLLAFVTRDKWLGKPDAVQMAATTGQSGETQQPAQTAETQNESAKTETGQAATTAPAKEPEQQAAVETKTEPEPAPEPVKPAEKAKVKPSVETFMIIDGLAIVNGRAEAGTKLKILNGEKVMGEVVANNAGDWHLTPEPILPPGEHYFVAETIPENGEPVRSDPSSKMIVAEKAKPEPKQTAAAETPVEPVEKQAEASDQQPAAQEETPTKPASEQEVAAVDTTAKQPEPEPSATPAVKSEPEPAEIPEVKVGSEPGQPTVAKTEPEPAPEPKVALAPATTPAPQPDPSSRITEDSMGLDYNDAGDIIVSGTSEPGGKVRIVIDNKPVGDVLADATGRWLFKDNGKIVPGKHDLRADKVLGSGAVVIGETFEMKREDPVKIAQPQPDPAKQNETVAIKTPEPAAPATEEAPETKVATTEVQTSGSETEQAAPAQETETAAVATETEAVKAEPVASTPAQGRVVIQPGNNLWNISRVIYGSGVEYTTIYEANKDQIRNPHRIYPGQIFMTPGTVPPEEIDPARREPLSSDEKQVQ